MRARNVHGLVAVFGCTTWIGCSGGPGTSDGQTDNGAPDDSDGSGVAVVAPVLPSDLTLDIHEFSGVEGASRPTSRQDGATTAEHGDVSQLTADVVVSAQSAASAALSAAASIHNDFVDAEQTHVSGSFTVNGSSIAYKADFTAFDIDGDGAADGSGAATVEPVAVRLWVDRGAGFERFLCALVTTRPTDDNHGAGEVRISPGAVIESFDADLRLSVQWDRTEADHHWNDVVIEGQLSADTVIESGRAAVDVRDYSSGETEITARFSATLTVNPYGFTTFASAAHYRRGGEGLLLSALAGGGLVPIIFSNVCVNIVSRTLATSSECDGFDLQDMQLLNTPAAGDADFPADFPEEPTF